VAIDLIGRLAVRVPKPELDVLKAAAIDLNEQNVNRFAGAGPSATYQSLCPTV
jgi:hypothetical protein